MVSPDVVDIGSEYFVVYAIMFSAYKATGSQSKLEDSSLKIISTLGDR